MWTMPDWSVALAVIIIFPLYEVAVGVMLRLYNIRIEKRRAQSVRLITETFDLTWAQNAKAFALTRMQTADALQTMSNIIEALHKDKVDKLLFESRFKALEDRVGRNT